MQDDQIKALHSAIHYVCSTSIGVLADSEKFPEHWLFKHRWGKGKKNQPAVLPNGDKITFLTVGGRTSAVVPTVQKKTGAVAKEIEENATQSTPANTKRKRLAPKKESDSEEENPKLTQTKKRGNLKQKEPAVKIEDPKDDIDKPAIVGRRRSTRVSN